MEWYWSFLLGILSGIITSIIVSALSNTATALKRFVPPMLRRSFDREFKNQKCAEKNILNDARRSSFMYVFALKGGSFSDNTGERVSILNKIFTEVKIEQRYLISAPEDKNPYVKVRAQELIDGLTLNEGIIASIKQFEKAIADPNRKITFRLHSEIVRFRLIIFDKCLYLSYQPRKVKGRLSPVQRYSYESSGYIAMKMFFDEKWKEYEDEENTMR